MSPHLLSEIARVRQQEIAANTIHAHHARDARFITARSSGATRTRFGRAVATLAMCLIATVAVTVSGARASSRPALLTSHVSASRLAREIHVLEADGYVPWQCTATGTVMRDSQGDFVKLYW